MVVTPATLCATTRMNKIPMPPPSEVEWAKRVLEALPDGSGAVMVEGKMQDDASWKQCKVMVDLAKLIAEKDPDLKEQYGF